jgi:peroxiredoxin
MTPTDTQPSPAGPRGVTREEAWRLSDGLLGRALPSVELMSCGGETTGVQDLGDAALYFYPGSRASPLENDTPMVDAVLHRAYRDSANELAQHGFKVLGISTEGTAAQARIAQANSVTHQLLTDPECRLGRDLGLSTFPLDEALRYQRIALVVCDGLIRRAFFPILSASHNPRHVLSWIRARVAR